MKIGIIGGGASGAMLACQLGEFSEVTIIEKNEKIGKKLFITGKGRCNVTNYTEIQNHLKHILRNPKFLLSSLYGFSAWDTMEFFENAGVNLKVERGERVFPVSNKSSDIIKALNNKMKSNNVNILLNTNVASIEKNNNNFNVYTSNGIYNFDKVVIATGGLTYKQTGSTGDGYKFAKRFGHKIVNPVGALLGIELSDEFQLAGLALRNVTLNIEKDNKKIYSELGEMLFTHKGISGPIVLSASSKIVREDINKLKAYIDLKPALTNATLDARILRDFKKYNNKNFSHSIKDLLPQRLIDVIVEKTNISREKKVNVITKEERAKLLYSLKHFDIHLKKMENSNQGIITVGGVSTKEINPSTMESRLQKSLYFCGEVLDVDATTGGYNLQIAFATAKTVAEAIKSELE